MSLSAHQRQLEKQIRKERPGLLNGLPGDKKKQLVEFLETQIPPGHGMVVTAHTQTQVTSSPVPPAELLMGYNDAIPDGANRLFTLVENQSQHRQQLENKMASGQLDISRRGQTFALMVTLFFGSIGGVLAYMGQKEVAIAIFTVTIGAIASCFIVGQLNQKRNLDQKAPKG